MNYCCDCKWYKKTGGVHLEPIKHMCTHLSLGKDIVTGEPVIEDCYFVRENLCGHASVWFEAKK